MTSQKEKYSNKIGQATGATDISYLGKNQFEGSILSQTFYTFVEENPYHVAGAVDNIAQKISYNKYDQGYLGISFDIESNPEVKAKAEETGIGLLSLGEIGEPKVLTPPSTRSDVVFKQFIPKEFHKKIENLENSEKLKEEITGYFDKMLKEQKIKDFPEEIIISVILAGIFGSASWYIIQFYLELYQNENFIVWAFIICGVIIFLLTGYYFILRKKNKKLK